MTPPREDLECSRLLFIIIFLVSIPNNILLILNHFSFPFLPFFFHLLNFFNSTWSSGMGSLLINICDPFKLGVILSMSYLWSLELSLTQINLYLFSIIFPNLFSSIIQVVSIFHLFFSYSLTIANVSSNSMTFFISSLIYPT